MFPWDTTVGRRYVNFQIFLFSTLGLCWVDGLGIFRGILKLIIERKKKNVANTAKNMDSPSL